MSVSSPVSSVQCQAPGARIPRSIPERFVALSRLCGVAVVMVGLAVLTGWAFDIPALKSALPGLVTMKANTALAFVLSGLALVLKGTRSAANGSPVRSWAHDRQGMVANLCAAAVALLGAVTLCEYLCGLDWPIDDLLFREAPGAILTLHPGRMAPNTAVNFVLLGVALLILDVEMRYGRRPAQFLAAAGGLIALLAFTGYIYGDACFRFGIGRFTAMALHTTVAFGMLSFGILLARPDKGWGVLFSGDTVAARLARRLIPVAVATPLLLGWLTKRAERTGLFNNDFGAGVFALGVVLIVGVVVWRTAVSLARLEIERQGAASRYKTLFESSSDAVMTLEPPSWRFTSGNPATVRMFKAADEQDFTEHEPWTLSPERQPDGRPSGEKAKEMIETAMREGSHSFEWTHQRIGGEAFPATVHLSRMESGGKGCLQATVRDITEQKRAEEALRKEGRLLAEAERLGHIGSWFIDTAGLLSWSDEMYRVYGVSPAAFTPSVESVLGLIHSDDRVAMQRWIEFCAAGQKPDALEFRIRRPDGTIRYIRGTGEAVHDAGNRLVHMAGMGQDITERRQAEDQLQRQQTLASIGTLARGMAHEINNPIMGVANYAQLIKDRAAGNATLVGFADEIIAEGKRVATMTHSLLSFTQEKEEQQFAPASPNDLVVSVLPPASAAARGLGIDLSCDLPADLPRVSCSQRQIGQVVAALLANALEAWEGGTLDAGHPVGGGKIVRLTAERFDRAGQPCVRLTVEDNGPGIPADIRERVFDPFFTTKDRTQHSGLGLWISRSIVNNHGGEIRAESEVGKGTRVHVDLPVGSGEQ